jgi:adenylate cyclase
MPSTRRLAAIMFTDMVGYTALAQADEASALAVLERHNRILRSSFPKFRGREVKTVGDAFLLEFESALDATKCALELQRSLHDYNTSAPDGWQIRVRIGIHVGDVEESGGDVLGDAVNLAARIQPRAEPGGICLSQQVYDQVANKLGAAMVRLPPVALKNVRTPMVLYRVALPWLEASPEVPLVRPAGGRHLAVLPLANISPDPGDGYFADGLTEELISVLSQVRHLNVIARTSVTPYKLTPKSVAQVGTELGVDTIIEGSVRKAGNKIRITLQLIDVATQQHLWASNYDRELNDVFAVQTDIAQRTAEAMRLELSKLESDEIARRPTENVEAYDQYLHGLVAASEYSLKAYREAVRCFERATALDPTLAEAYAAWANLNVAMAGDTLPPREVIPQARELAEKALALDPDLSDAHAARANILFQDDLDWAGAEAEFRRAIELNPSNVTALRFFSLMLFALSRFDDARELTRRLIRLDPGGPHRRMLAWIDLDTGKFDAAIAEFEKRDDDTERTVGDRANRGMFLLAIGRTEDARREAEAPTHGASPDELYDHALLNALLGRPEAAQAFLSRLEGGRSGAYLSATYVAMLYAALGRGTEALDLLERDFREGDHILWLWHRGVYFDGIRQDPRFVALLRQYGLPLGPIFRLKAPR